MPIRSVVLIVVVALTFVWAEGATAALAPRAETGPAEGVQATVAGTVVEVRFAGASASWGKAHAGQRVVVTCASHPAPGLAFAKAPTASSLVDAFTVAKVTADGTSLRATLKAPGDACEIIDTKTMTSFGGGQARAALTPAGATWIDEQVRATRMVDVAYAAKPSGTYRTAAEVVALAAGEVVALGDPNGTPPSGKIGYWSHGRAVSLITISAAGRRLVLQDLGGGMLRTDVLDALAGWTPPQGISDAAAEALGDEEQAATEEDDDFDPGQGVQARVVAGGKVVIRFTGASAATYRRIAGRRVRVVCVAVPGPPLLGEVQTWKRPTAATVRVPRHGGVLRATARGGARDLCAVELAGSGRDVAFAPLSVAGRRYLADVGALFAFVAKVPGELAAAGMTSYPGTATIVAAHDGLIPMASPGQKLPIGELGVWSDAGRRAVLAMTGPDGRRFVFADEGDGTLRTNIFGWLLSMSGTLAA